MWKKRRLRQDTGGDRETERQFALSLLLRSVKEVKPMNFRIAERKDCALILSFINGLADYEKMSDQVVATEAMHEEGIF